MKRIIIGLLVVIGMYVAFTLTFTIGSINGQKELRHEYVMIPKSSITDLDLNEDTNEKMILDDDYNRYFFKVTRTK